MSRPVLYGPNGSPLSGLPGASNPPAPVNQFMPANNNWWQWTQHFLTVFVNPLDMSVTDCERIARTDETAYAALKFTELAALARLGDYTHPRKRIERFIRKCLGNLGSTNFISCVEQLLTARWAGYSVGEILLRKGLGGNDLGKRTIELDGLQVMHPDSLHLDIYKVGPAKNKLRVIYQWLWQSYEVQLPPEKCVVLTHDALFGNFYGNPVVRSVYAPWFLKSTVLMQAWGLALERYGTPIGVANVPNGNDLIDPTGTMNVGQMTVFQYVDAVISNLSSKGSLVLSDGIKYQLTHPPAGVGKDFQEAVLYCNQMIARGCLVPSLVADHGGGHGSYSLGQKHFDLFVLTLEKLLSDLIQVLIHQLVRRLVILNFGPQSDGDYGDFSVENFQADDEKLLSEVFVNLVNCGVLDPSRLDDLNYARQRIGLSLLGKGEVQPFLPTPDRAVPQPAETGTAPAATVPHPTATIQEPIPAMRSTGLVARMRQRSQAATPLSGSDQRQHQEMTATLLQGIQLPA